ncbi:MAG: hypothetical protein ACLRMZ_17960 [Blautia marasmi]
MYIETWTKFDFPLLIGNTLLYTICTVLIIALLAPMAATSWPGQRENCLVCALC